MSTCPNNKQLLAWIQQPASMDNQDVADIEKHVAECAACQSLLGFLTDEPMLDGITPDPTNQRFLGEPQLKSLQKQFRDLSLQLESENSAYWPQPQTKVDTVRLERVETAGEDVDIDETWNEFPELDGFIFERRIGSGGFSSVYLAWDVTLARHVAIKMLEKNQNNPRNRHRFLREARAMARLENEFVVEIYHVDETKSGQPYIVMEYIAGETLESWIDQSTPVKTKDNDFRKLVDLIAQAAEGMVAAHQAGMIHRDIKPSNILIDDKNDILRAKLADFGLVKNVAEDSLMLTRTAEVVGTPSFMAPEQVVENGEIDHRSDVYSLGATLYYGMTGELLFNGSTVSIIRQIIDSQPQKPRSLNPNMPVDLETICLTAIAKKPEDRYQTASALVADMRNFLDGKPILARRPNLFKALFNWGQSNKTKVVSWLLLSTIILGTIVVAGFAIDNVQNQRLAEAGKTELSLRTQQLNITTDQLQKSDIQIQSTLDGFFEKIINDDTYRITLPAHARHEMVNIMLQQYHAHLKTKQDDRESTVAIAEKFAGVAEFLLDTQMMFQADNSIRTSLDHLKPFLNLPDTTERELTIAATLTAQQYEVAKFYRRKERAAIAEESLDFATRAVDANGGVDAKKQLIMAQANVALENNSESKIETLENCVTAIDDLCLENPQNLELQSERARVRRSLGKAQASLAAILRAESIEILEELARKEFERNGSNVLTRRAIAVNRTWLAAAYVNAKQHDLATQTFELAISELESLVRDIPAFAKPRMDLAETQVMLGNYLMKQNQKPDAIKKFESAISTFENLIAIDRHQTGAIRRSSMVSQQLAKIYAEQGDNDVADRHFETTVDSFKRLFDLNPRYFGKFDLQNFRSILKAAADHHIRTGDADRADTFRSMSSEFVAKHAASFE